MVEAPKSHNPDQKKKTFRVFLIEKMDESTLNVEYQHLPEGMKKLARDSALAALRRDRPYLYEEIIKMDKEAEEAEENTLAGYHRRIRGSLLDNREAVRMEIESSEAGLNQVAQSVRMTTLDRQVIASQLFVVGLARMQERESVDDIFQLPGLIEVGMSYCKKLVEDVSRLLPPLQRYKREDSEPVSTANTTIARPQLLDEHI